MSGLREQSGSSIDPSPPTVVPEPRNSTMRPGGHPLMTLGGWPVGHGRLASGPSPRRAAPTEMRRMLPPLLGIATLLLSSAAADAQPPRPSGTRPDYRDKYAIIVGIDDYSRGEG